jgi:hypothetical protein
MLHVSLGHSLRGPGKHCNDGDSHYITGSFNNILVCLSGVDTPEIRGLTIENCWNVDSCML